LLYFTFAFHCTAHGKTKNNQTKQHVTGYQGQDLAKDGDNLGVTGRWAEGLYGNLLL